MLPDLTGTGGPLSGLRVVDCSRGIAGTRATGMLADYGASVIWVEPPGGDPYREELAVEYSVLNRGKRSVVLDLKDDADRESLMGLLASADVFVQSWSPGVAERLGVGYDELHARFPDLVYCSISGFGSGPEELSGAEPIVQAATGAMSEQFGHRGGPIYSRIPFASIGAAYLAVIGTLAALVRRHDDGFGRHVETSLYDGMLAYLQRWGATDREVSGQTEQTDQYGGFRSVCRTFRCADGEYVGVNTMAVGAFNRLLAILGLEHRIQPSEHGLDMGMVATPEERAIMRDEFPEVFASKPRDEWVRLLLEADICVMPELHPGQVFDAPQVVFNGVVTTVDDPVLGNVEQVGPAAAFSRTPASVSGPAPTAGADQDAALGEGGDGERWSAPAASKDDRPLLDGLKIVDLGSYYAGPYASRLLADLGADVIKVEPPRGDAMRGRGTPFRSAQAGKRSLGIDLKDPGADEVRRRLFEWADVVHHNMRPGAAERVGCGYEQVCEVKPEVIYMHSPGWGADGPDKNRQSFAPLLSSYVGAGFEAAGQHNPPLFPFANEDSGNALLGAASVLMALLHRKRTGEGQCIVNPQLNAAIWHVAHVVRRVDGTVLGAGQLDPLQYGLSPLNRLYETADGWIVVVAIDDEDIARLGEVLGVDLLSDDRFATRAARDQNAYELADTLAAALGVRPTQELVERLTAASVPAAEPLMDRNFAFMTDPENERTGRVTVIPHAAHGAVRQFAMHFTVSDAALPRPRLAPELGEHTYEVLSMLELPDDLIAELKARDAIAQYDPATMASTL